MSGRSFLIVAALCLPLWAGAALPDWLGGPPDPERRADRCAVYDWFVEQADAQTDGRASGNELAMRRLLNAANKLVAHHREAGLDAYSAELRYLVTGEEGPYHFSFRLSADALENLLARDCEAGQ